MILDGSVILAVVRRETGFDTLIAKLERSTGTGIGTPTLTEAGIVIASRLGLEPRNVLERFLSDFDVTPIPFGGDHWREALRAFEKFGKGRHAAALNFGDCLTYAVARLARQPLLFTGDDFSRTDLDAA